MVQRPVGGLPLDRALEGLRTRILPPCTVALTIDDGFTSVHRHALQLLMRYEIPATMSVTTYYLQRQTPVFNLAIDYMLASSQVPTLDLKRWGSRTAHWTWPAATVAALPAVPSSPQPKREPRGLSHRAVAQSLRVVLGTTIGVVTPALGGSDELGPG